MLFRSGEWAYHGTADLGAGTVTVVPTQATDYYVLLLGGADGYTELTDPDNRVMVTVIPGDGPNDGHLWSGDYLTSDITYTATSLDGMSTYRISVTDADVGTLSRGEAERDLQLMGLLLFRNELKPDTAGAIGRRYRRNDEVGTPFCITVDFQTLEDDTVTLRDRDSTEQRRLTLPELLEFMEEAIDA